MGGARRPEAGSRRQPVDSIPGEDEGEADAAEDDRHAQAEGDRENQAVGRPIHVDRGEEDDQGIGRRDQPTGKAQHEQTPPADRSVGRGEVLMAVLVVEAVLARVRVRLCQPEVGEWPWSRAARARSSILVGTRLAKQQPGANREDGQPGHDRSDRVEQLRGHVADLEDHRREQDDPERVGDGHRQAQGDRMERGPARADEVSAHQGLAVAGGQGMAGSQHQGCQERGDQDERGDRRASDEAGDVDSDDPPERLPSRCRIASARGTERSTAASGPVDGCASAARDPAGRSVRRRGSGSVWRRRRGQGIRRLDVRCHGPARLASNVTSLTARGRGMSLAGRGGAGSKPRWEGQVAKPRVTPLPVHDDLVPADPTGAGRVVEADRGARRVVRGGRP